MTSHHLVGSPTGSWPWPCRHLRLTQGPTARPGIPPGSTLLSRTELSAKRPSRLRDASAPLCDSSCGLVTAIGCIKAPAADAGQNLFLGRVTGPPRKVGSFMPRVSALAARSLHHCCKSHFATALSCLPVKADDVRRR